jgi:hypothetical protein
MRTYGITVFIPGALYYWYLKKKSETKLLWVFYPLNVLTLKLIVVYFKYMFSP